MSASQSVGNLLAVRDRLEHKRESLVLGRSPIKIVLRTLRRVCAAVTREVLAAVPGDGAGQSPVPFDGDGH